MNHTTTRARSVALACAAAAAASALLSGCATQTTPPLYGWDGYQPQVYDYLQGKSSPQTQIAALEQSLQKMAAKGEAVPPGFHAHLGALYASAGKRDDAQRELLAEKSAFPESSAYMDFLLTNLKK
ncbi:DUF4810 domain-containing protein [Paraburkholderia acidisoli]|uniref:DUF4810 domain-containing protein n=1 Tax=Paraburkholderia acidisoli TaxID=2571748 RepID=A0A7Z2GI87_9BURK|nr:DUF4810 domain-containing protein [Paraburkholderia acidisoli]QGZ62298.1 DUF4810 domain-containing protein [Paraburkholderia acidisoli]